ncbi:hypothetical protein ETB97_010322 [Aspergillus alliaceus]|uniref:Uncharacterized protein n=1 Tax=Petromyces alliaceus TaxID=209559 RepID=A0A8H6A9V2_PETAA|nr:hypothetical protein ETB97_010322 [Aspergillus burnettii]
MEMYLVLPDDDDALIHNVTRDHQAYAASYPGLKILENRYTTFAKNSGFLQGTQSIADQLTPSGPHEVLAGRLLPHNLFDSLYRDPLVDAVKSGIKNSDNFIPRIANIPVQINMTTPANHQDGTTAEAHPAWRNALWHLIYAGRWADGVPSFVQNHILTSLLDSVDPFKKLTHGGGCYVNTIAWPEERVSCAV